MKILTRSGSLYEVDPINKRVRVVVRGWRGDWKVYTDIVPDPIEVGKSVVFVWERENTPLLPLTELLKLEAVPTTMTSPVVSIDSENGETS